MAPGASIVAPEGGRHELFTSAILQSIDYAVSTAHVDVINESFGRNAYPDNGSLGDRSLQPPGCAAGVTITVSTGDAGVTGTIGQKRLTPQSSRSERQPPIGRTSRAAPARAPSRTAIG